MESEPEDAPSQPSVGGSNSDSESDNDNIASASRQPRSAQDENESIHGASSHGSHSQSSSGYLSAVRARSLAHSRAPPNARSYAFEAVLSIAHSTQVNAFAGSPSFGSLYSGGADGFVRRYSLARSLDNSSWDQPQLANLSAKPIGSAEQRLPVLSGYWENEEPGPWTADLLGGGLIGPQGSLSRAEAENKTRWGPKTALMGTASSAVYSLAVQSQELWGLSGTGRGSINLWTIRHDEGQTRHVFPPSRDPSEAHLDSSPVSALLLGRDEQSFLSGAWDSRIVEWDLNTGAATRSYNAHIGQISSLAWQPLASSVKSSTKPNGEDAEMADVSLDAPSPASSTSSSGIAAALTGTAGGVTSEPPPTAEEDDADADADGEEDADGEVDFDSPSLAKPASLAPVEPNGAFKSALPDKTAPSKAVPVVGGAESVPALSRDVFLSSSVDGEVMLWDRRVKSTDKGGVRKLAGGGTNAGWCSAAIWSATSPQEIFVGRRNASTSVYDLRHSTPSAPTVLSLCLPAASGPVSSLLAMPSGRHLVTASQDVLRLWDLDKARETDGKRGWKVIVGASADRGGRVSSIGLSADGKWLASAGGNRGWEGSGTESLVVYEVKSLL